MSCPTLSLCLEHLAGGCVEGEKPAVLIKNGNQWQRAEKRVNWFPNREAMQTLRFERHLEAALDFCRWNKSHCPAHTSLAML